MKRQWNRTAWALLLLILVAPWAMAAEQQQRESDELTITTSPKGIQRTKPAQTKPAPDQPAATKTVREAVKETLRGTLNVTRPGSGAHFFQGEEVAIEWSKQGSVPDKCFRISLYRDGQEVREITPKVCVNGYRWKVPDDVWGSSYRVQVTTTDRKVSAQSPPFPIDASQADLTVGKLTAAPETLKAGEEVTIRIRIDNTGKTKSKPTKAFILLGSWWSTYGSARRIEYEVPALAFGDHTYITHKEKPPAGDWIVKAVVGPFFTPGSGDKFAPDTRSAWLRVSGDNLPDLVACIYHPIYATGGSAWIRAAVQNTGKAAMGPTKARIWVEGAGSFEFDVPELRRNDIHQLQKAVPLAGEGDVSYRVDVDVDPELHWTELSETNNSITGRILRKEPKGGKPDLTTFCSDGRRF